jgi:hypothetical protein
MGGEWRTWSKRSDLAAPVCTQQLWASWRERRRQTGRQAASIQASGWAVAAEEFRACVLSCAVLGRPPIKVRVSSRVVLFVNTESLTWEDLPALTLEFYFIELRLSPLLYCTYCRLSAPWRHTSRQAAADAQRLDDFYFYRERKPLSTFVIHQIVYSTTTTSRRSLDIRFF